MRERGRWVAVAGSDWSRRDFTRAVAGASAASVFGLDAGARSAGSRVDSLLGQFCRTLSADQRRALRFSGDDPRRTMVQNHWAVVPGPIASLTAEQQELALGLIREVCTLEGFAALTRARDDDAGGWKHDHLAIFGDPDGSGRFEWVLTGRHLTLRGSSTGAITAGPLFFGHSVLGPDNIWQGLADRVEMLFRSLDARQRSRAIVPVGQAGASGSGLVLGGLDSNQGMNVRQVVATLMGPFRRFDVSVVQACLIERGGLQSLRWQAFRSESEGDLRGEPPKVWRLVGPGFSWSYHGEPHAHLWFDVI